MRVSTLMRVDLSMVALRSLYEVDQRGTMTAAAEALGYTPGAVSLHISSLTRAIGAPVVEQAGRRVRLTEAGQLLLEHARRMVESEELLERALHEPSTAVAGVVTVGAHGSGSMLVGEVADALRRAHPELEVRVREVRETSSDNTVLAVMRGDVDVAIEFDYPDAPIPRSDELAYRVVETERFGVAGLAPEEGAERVCLADLAGLDWVLPPLDSAYGQAVRAACRRAGFEPRARHVVTDTVASLRLAARGLGVTLATPRMRDFARADDCQWHSLEDEVVRHVVALHRGDQAGRSTVAAFLAALDAVEERAEGAVLADAAAGADGTAGADVTVSPPA